MVDEVGEVLVTAALDVRARRRLDELRAAGRAAIYEDVLQELNERDIRDAGRSAAPMAAPPDATVLDTTTLDSSGRPCARRLSCRGCSPADTNETCCSRIRLVEE